MIDGKGVRGYGAYAFRKEDQAFVDAFNAELAKFLGTEEHKSWSRPSASRPRNCQGHDGGQAVRGPVRVAP